MNFQNNPETTIKPLVLTADVPQQIIGEFSALKILEGAYHSFRIFYDRPGTQAGSDALLRSRRLERNGKTVVGPFKNPWIVAISQSPKTGTPPLKLLLYRGAIGFVENDDSDGLLMTNVGTLIATALGASAEQLLGSTGNDSQGVGDGDSEVHSRGFWSGFVSSTKAFRVEVRATDTLFGSHVLCAAKSRNMGGHHTLNLDVATWDTLWEKNAPTSWTAFSMPSRLPVSFGIKQMLYYVDTVAAASVVNSFVGIRSR